MPDPATLVLMVMLLLFVGGLLVCVALFVHGLRARAEAQRLASLAPSPKAAGRTVRAARPAGVQAGSRIGGGDGDAG